jgi:hypothetical protein
MIPAQTGSTRLVSAIHPEAGNSAIRGADARRGWEGIGSVGARTPSISLEFARYVDISMANGR